MGELHIAENSHSIDITINQGLRFHPTRRNFGHLGSVPALVETESHSKFGTGGVLPRNPTQQQNLSLMPRFESKEERLMQKTKEKNRSAHLFNLASR